MSQGIFKKKSWDKSVLVDEVRSFVPLNELEKNDEYREMDLYGVEDGLGGKFQQRRVKMNDFFLRHFLKKNGFLLDIGCGEGHLTNFFTSHTSNIYGTDLSISAIKKASHKYPHIDFCVSDALNLPYEFDFFSAVICNNLFEHVDNPRALLLEINSVMQSGGFLFLSTPSLYRFENMLRIILGQKVKKASKQHVAEYSVNQVGNIAKETGFDVVKVLSTPVWIPETFWFMKIIFLVLVPLKVLLYFFLKSVGSDHVLESTAFFVLRKN